MILRITHITSIARTAIAEAIRKRILYGIFAFAIGLILLSAVLSNLTVGYRVRIVTDLSLSAVSASGILMAILLGVGSISGEIDRRTAYFALSKPVSRWEFILGKYFGIVGVLLINVLPMVAAAAALISLYSYPSGFQYAPLDFAVTIGLLIVRLLVIAALSITISTVASATISLIASLGISVAAYLTPELRHFLGTNESGVVRSVGELLFRVLPDFSALDTLQHLIHEVPVLRTPVLTAATYALLYVMMLLFLAGFLFRRRDVG